MKIAGRIILVLLVIALSFGIYFVVKMPEKTEMQVTEGEEVLTDEGFTVKTVSDEILKISLKNEYGVFNFEKENGQWMSVFDEKVKTIGNTIVALESIIKDTVALDEIEKDTTSLDVYGLEKPVAVLKYETAGGETGYIKLGNSIVNVKSYFTFDDKNVYTMDAFDAAMFMTSMRGFADMGLLRTNAEEVNSVEIRNGEKDIIIERKQQEEINPDDASALFSYALRSPVKENASNNAVQTLIQEIAAIDAVSYNPYISDEDAGFTESLKSFSVTSAGKKQTFVLGNTYGKEDIYVKKEGVKGAYVVPLNVLGFIERTAFDYVDKHIVLFYMDEVSCIRIEAFGNDYEFMLGSAKTFNGEAVDEETVKDIYEVLMGLSYEGNVSDEFNADGKEAEIKIIFYRNGKKDITEYVPHDAMNYAVRRNGAAEFTIQRKYVEKVLSLVKEL